MDPGYETVVDFADLFFTMAVYLLHGVIVFLHTSLACFLIATGSHNLFLPTLDGVWLRRLGVTGIASPDSRPYGVTRILLGLLLFAPIALAAPVWASLLAGIGAFALLLFAERRLPAADVRIGRFVRRAAISFAAIASLFMLWEGEDNLALGADLLVHSMEWRQEELSWQLSQDPKSPKVGDLAPDFTLEDPEGNARVRLSDFRGKRPVALVFGSYT